MRMAAETLTIVLVHGAGADATGFDVEIRGLQDRGYSAIGLRDLAADAAYLAEFLRTLSEPIVPVGHSYDGNVISAAAIGSEQVRAKRERIRDFWLYRILVGGAVLRVWLGLTAGWSAVTRRSRRCRTALRGPDPGSATVLRGRRGRNRQQLPGLGVGHAPAGT
jgi:pimeloyl-ACP methyl ester carboxylesterase